MISACVTTRAMIDGRETGERSGAFDFSIGLERMDGKRFASRLFRQLQSCPPPRRIVALVHGFNVRHEEATRWQQGLAESLALPGTNAYVLFSWPSDGLATRYLDDRAAARHAGTDLAELLLMAHREITRRRCDVELCLVAHSMGAYVTSCAAHAAAESLGYPSSAPIFSEVVWCSPDLDAEALGDGGIARQVPVFTRRLTVYYSRRDGVLAASSAKRFGVTGARLGRSGPEGTVPSNVVSVDGTQRVDSHSGWWDDPATMEDISLTLQSVDRKQMHRAENDYGKPELATAQGTVF